MRSSATRKLRRRKAKSLKCKGAGKNIYPGIQQCHPRVKEGTCLPRTVLEKAGEKLGISLPGSVDELEEKIAKHLKVDKDNQRTLVRALPFSKQEKDSLEEKWLRPPLPIEWKTDPDAWLDSNNIRDVLKQYEDVYKFKCLGPFPIDFAAQDPYQEKGKCMNQEMCTLNLKEEAAKGIEHIGFAFNLDPHYKNGSHWMAAYINIPNKKFYYFDSYGLRPPKQIYKYMQWMTIQEPNMELGWNGKRCQRKQSECGTFCIYFIDRMIAGEPFLDFCRRSPSDEFALSIRKWLYSS